ncbi:MAG TPA: hypothetical protein VLM40_05505, partial [Gemmata sp.]|nr:hypothetical protein [Gemmata sp.]
WLLLLTARGPWRRAAALGLLCCSAVLVRNELSVAAGLLALVLGWYEWRRGESPLRPSRVLLAYATISLLAAGVCGLAYSASIVKYPVLTQTLHHKHAVNMAQVYAFAYQQRHPEWTGSPWFNCYSLMETQFGNKTPTLREMIRANPAAVREHFAWNLSLAPSGLQLLLFNRASGSISPDYDGNVIPRLNKRRASYLSWLVVGIWAAGFFALWRGRREWWRDWLSTRGLGWAGMFAVAAVAVPIILTQRPRPSYLFSLGIVLIAITGMCFHAATARWRLTEWLRHVMPILMVVGVFLVPRYFTRAAAEQRPLALGVERLVPFRDELQSAARLGLVVPACDVGTYICPTALHLDPRDEFTKERLAHSKFKRIFELTDFSRLANRNDHFGEMLARHKVTHVYLDEQCLKQLATGDYGEAGDFIAGRDHPSGWGLVGSGNASGDRWRLYRREE